MFSGTNVKGVFGRRTNKMDVVYAIKILHN
jgi:hypothetical protein